MKVEEVFLFKTPAGAEHSSAIREGGGGAIGSVGKAFNFGPITGGDLGNARSVLSKFSVSTGWQSVPSVGAQGTANSSGLLYGPTFGTPGWSLSGTYSFCGY